MNHTRFLVGLGMTTALIGSLHAAVHPCAMQDKQAKIFVAGHRGLVGSALVRALHDQGYTNIVVRTHHELDLRDQQAVDQFFAQERPDYVFLAAAKVGGILANSTYPADFMYDNLMISAHVIHAAYTHGVKKLLFLGSSCIYPRLCPQPIKEDYLLTGALETTNEPYALAKIAGIRLCQAYNKQYGTNFISCMPTNLYGPGDNFDLQNSHVMPALMAKMHAAKMRADKEVVIWGTGAPFREFLYVDDLADACIFLMQHYEGNDIVNVGTGSDITIKDLALTMKQIIGFEGELVFDATKPDGTPRKVLDVSRLQQLGWQARTGLQEGIAKTYAWYCATQKPVNNHTSQLRYVPFDQAMSLDQYRTILDSQEIVRRLDMHGHAVYDFFKNLYEKNSFLRVAPCEAIKIPKIVHQIWIGDRVPEKFKTLQATWQRHHPDWEFRLWTQHDIESMNFLNADLIAQSRNPGEISDIMRYEILYRFGGVYVDMDFECLAPLDELHARYDLYVGIQPLDSELVQLGIGIIGAVQGHPVLAHAISNLRRSYHDPVNRHNAPARTGPLHFTKSFLAVAGRESCVDVALPASYFYPLACHGTTLQCDQWIKMGSFGVHHWAKSWLHPQFRKSEFQQLE